MANASTTQGAVALPLGRRVPRGRMRWYLVACPLGQEAEACQKIRRIVPANLLDDAFVPRVERVRKVDGAWTIQTRELFAGYFVVATKDARALSKVLAGLSFPVQLAGNVGRGYAPMDEDARQFLEGCMDATHTIRRSEGEIVSDELHVLDGPLKGKEERVRRYNRRKAVAAVHVGDERSEFTLLMPLAIPVRR